MRQEPPTCTIVVPDQDDADLLRRIGRSAIALDEVERLHRKLPIGPGSSATGPSDIVADDEFATLIPPLTDDEFVLLEQSVLTEGCREPLLVTPDGVLLDGHNRLRICREHDIPFRTKVIHVTDRDDALLWIVTNQLARRNLSAIDRIALVEKREPLLRARAAARQATRSQLPQSSAEANQGEETREVAARAAGVSRDTYSKGKKVLERGVPEIVQAVRDGDASIHAASKVADLPADEQKAIVAAGNVKEKANAVANRRTRNTGNNEWYTPDAHLDAAREVMGTIDLDPASCWAAQRRVRAETYYDRSENGLSKPWHGTAWLNPPYSRGLIGKFVDKLIDEHLAGNVSAAILLTNNETESAWFQKAASAASRISFPNRRFRILEASGKHGSLLQGQALFYFGADGERFTEVFAKFGQVVIPAAATAAPDASDTAAEEGGS